MTSAMVGTRCAVHRGRRGNALALATLLLAVLSAGPVPAAHGQTAAQTIARVKSAVVAVGTFQRTRAPQFRFLGTGFAVADGSLVATNAHVLPEVVDAGNDPESLAILLPGPDAQRAQVRTVARAARDDRHDLALLRVGGLPLPALVVRDSAAVAEGDQFLFTGFPIGSALGPYPATHRAMVSSITPIALPPANAQQLDPKVVRRLQAGSYAVFQLDATAYPGNSGSPLFDAATGEVVGVINMVFVKGTKEAALAQPSGITYAIPSRHLLQLLRATR
ncbi:MAG: serine protease [Pseudomonadota bacterium]